MVRFAAFLFVAACLCRVNGAEAQNAQKDFYITDGEVSSMVLSGNTLYVAGWFTKLAYGTRGAVPLDATSGAPDLAFPRVSGSVTTVAHDGSGGWYLGGVFTAVGGVARVNLAHVLSNNVVDAWDPGVNGSVADLAVIGTTVYVGGFFSTIGGQPRNGIAALDGTTGLATAWNPNAENPNVNPPRGRVSALAVSGTTIYVAGEFTAIGGQPRHNIAALGTTLDTNNATAWDPGMTGNANVLTVSGTTVYAGGPFTTIGGRPRNNLAALDATINTVNATPWNPNPNGQIMAIVVSGSTVYVAGYFSSIGGQLRNSIAAVDATLNTSNATPWNPNAGNAVVNDLAVDGTTIYACGNFTTIGGQPRSSIAALDATINTNNATAWDPSAIGNVDIVMVNGGSVFAAGSFTGMGAVTRNHIAALDVTTGIPTPWDPNANGNVYTLAVSGTTVYAGGFFTSIGGQLRNSIAALDATTNVNNATPWDPNAGNNTVFSLAVSGTTVYTGGTFTSIGGQTRNKIAALDATTGGATAWDPSANMFPGFPYIGALVVSGNTVYVAGKFATIGGQSRNNIAALNATLNTNNATAWNPNANGEVRALVLSGGKVYAGGDFTSIGDISPRNYIAALDSATGFDTNWNPNPNSIVFGLALSGNTMYAGGAFTSIGGQTRNHVASLSTTINANNATSWNPNANGNVATFALGGGVVYAGGSFTIIGNSPQAYLAAIGYGLADVPDAIGGDHSLLQQNLPNPFRKTTRIRFSLATAENVTLEVYDLSGRIVATPLRNVRLGPGLHDVQFHGRDLPPGIYHYRLQAGRDHGVGRMILTR